MRRTSCPCARSSAERASTCRPTPPGYVYEYGETSPTRTISTVAQVPYATLFAMEERRVYVKYTFLKVDPAWRRRSAEERAADKSEFAAACNEFGTSNYLRAYSLVGTRGD